jgi:flagellar biosynthesis protein FlhF
MDGIGETLERAGLDSSVSDALASEWAERREVESVGDWTEVLHDRLEQRCEPPREVAGGGVRMLVGAPGVGKTTTLAKLAGRNEEGERDVALVSLDHFRIGATDQLRRYAELLDSPFVEAAKAEEIGALAGRYAGFEILVDTAGRGRHTDERMMGLEPLREQLGAAARVELVIDATARPELQRSQLRRFAPLGPDRMVLTKTDECENLASLANLMLDPLCPPVCWRGSGQRVPEDLLPVDAGAIVRDVLEAAA